MTDSGPVDAQEIRRRIAAERDTTLQRVTGLGHAYGVIVESSRDVATDDEHDPEGQTIAYERAQVSMLLGEARERLHELDRALDRLDEGRYGGCERCGGPIAADRLAARPAVRTCITCASRRRA